MLKSEPKLNPKQNAFAESRRSKQEKRRVKGEGCGGKFRFTNGPKKTTLPEGESLRTALLELD